MYVLERIYRDKEYELSMLDVTPEDYYEPFIKSFILRYHNSIVIIETGPLNGVDKLLRYLEEIRDIDNVRIIVTHIHLDHAGGAGYLANKLESRGINTTVYVHPRGLKHLVNPEKLWASSLSVLGKIAQIYGKPEPLKRELGVETSDGQLIRIGARTTIKILHTPGHASHHQSIVMWLGNNKILFSGDSVGVYIPSIEAIVPTTPPPFKLELYLDSLDKMESFKPEKIAFTHVGIGEADLLRKHRKQISLWISLIKELSENNREIDTNKILDELRKRDTNVEKIYNQSLAALGTIHHSINGMVQYVLSKS